MSSKAWQDPTKEQQGNMRNKTSSKKKSGEETWESVCLSVQRHAQRKKEGGLPKKEERAESSGGPNYKDHAC